MVQVFLTGGSGLLGNNILRAGLQRGWTFRTMARSTTDMRPFQDLQLELVSGDLFDRKAIEAAVSQSDVVVHSAAHIHIGWQNLDEALRVNRDGTQSIVEAAIKFNKPLVHVSTVNTLAIGKRDAPANEETPGDGQIPSTYVVSKRAAEQVVRTAMKQTDNPLHATIVYPGFMLGPYDWKPSSGRMIVELSKNCPPMSPSGGCSVCDVRDVAEGVLNIIQLAKYDHRYILAGNNMTYFDLWKAIAKRFNRRGPWTILRKPGQVVVGGFSDRFLCRPGKEVDTNSAAIKMGSQFHYYDSSLAMSVLGYSVRPFDETLDTAIEWLRENKKFASLATN